jgi:hypothetical protein
MNKLLLLLFIPIAIANKTSAQTYPENFIIPVSSHVIHNSLYKTIGFIDSRPTDGLLTRKPKRVTAIPISNQLNNLMDSVTDSTAKDGALLLQLRLLNFAEVSGTINQKGTCYLRAILYSKKGDLYQKINSIDTSVGIQVSPNLSKGALSNGGKIISAFVINNLVQESTDSTLYSLNDIKKVDSAEKAQLKLYTTLTYTDGLYNSYESFKNQMPDKQIIKADTNMNGNVFTVKIIDNGQKVKIKPKDMYAVVYKGVPYMATKYGCYRMQKENGNFFFTGDLETKSDIGESVTNGAAFGLLGGVASLGEETTYDMRLDNVNGKFIRLKQIDTSVP